MLFLDVCLYTACVPGACRAQRTAAEAVELALQWVLSVHLGAKTQPGAPEKQQALVPTQQSFQSINKLVRHENEYLCDLVIVLHGSGERQSEASKCEP